MTNLFKTLMTIFKIKSLLTSICIWLLVVDEESVGSIWVNKEVQHIDLISIGTNYKTKR